VNRYHIFETAHGFVAIGWNSEGINALRLPSRDADHAERALLRRLPDAMAADPPEQVARVFAGVRRYFNGEAIDFQDVPVALGEQEPFFTRVYAAVRELGWGETTTYGAVARELGAGTEMARAVGQAMAHNPVPLIVPCHRVLAAGGKVGGFSAPGGSESKARMLAMEGVMPHDGGVPATASAQQSFAF
jgi:methylated-DNA-[protein]-cysteine S-methyltransferase